MSSKYQSGIRAGTVRSSNHFIFDWSMEGDEDAGGEKKIDNEVGDGLSLLSGSDGADDEETFSSNRVNNKVRV